MNSITNLNPTNTENAVMVNYDQMVKVLMAVTGATPATIIAETPVKMNKTGNPYHDKIIKRQKSNVFINFDYAKSVNAKLVKEGKTPDFVASPRKWGTKLPGTPVVFYAEKQKYYLETRFLGNEPKVEYFQINENGSKEITEKSLFEQFLPPSKSLSSEHQGLDEAVILRDFDVANIYSIAVGGKTYIRKDF
jgi:hypothetical protein